MYKLTNQDLTTYNNTLWTPGEWKETSGQGGMCGPGWLHCYSDPELAMLLNWGHADYLCPRLWEIEADGEYRTDGLKHATTRQRLIRELPIPEITFEQKMLFVVLCAQLTSNCNKFHIWSAARLLGSVLDIDLLDDRKYFEIKDAQIYGFVERWTIFNYAQNLVSRHYDLLKIWNRAKHMEDINKYANI